MPVRIVSGSVPEAARYYQTWHYSRYGRYARTSHKQHQSKQIVNRHRRAENPRYDGSQTGIREQRGRMLQCEPGSLR